MYCQNCGTKNIDSASYCANCGTKLVNSNHIINEQKNNNVSSAAIAGFVVSLVSILCGVFVAPPIVGLIISIAGLNEINKNGCQGKGLAIAGIVISSIILAFWILVWGAFLLFGFSRTL